MQNQDEGKDVPSTSHWWPLGRLLQVQVHLYFAPRVFL